MEVNKHRHIDWIILLDQYYSQKLVPRRLIRLGRETMSLLDIDS